MTDTAISGYMETRERELIPWLPAEGDALESLGGIEHGGGGSRWDQFATNEKRFGVTTDYHEDIYTTKLDRSRPDFRAREKEAARLAAEIEKVGFNWLSFLHFVFTGICFLKAPAAFAHVAEERGLEGDADAAGMDEEDK
jgi:PAB1-binding protein PBP1